MKKIILILIIISAGIAAEAQGIFSIGPKVGYNSYNLTDNIDSIQSSIKNSFQVGAFVRLGRKFYIQPEANYQIDESTLSQQVGSTVMNQDVTIKSLKVPVIFGYKLINKGPFNLRLLAGPAVTFALNKQLDPENMGELWPIRSADDLKNSTWSIQMGGGIDVFFMTLDVRYEVGVDNIYNGSSSLEMKNNIFNVSLGVKFL
jgi:Outer membrane protein beta-barrel domain